MGKRRGPTREEMLAQLGIISLNNVGLPIYNNEPDMSSAEALASQESMERIYGTNPIGNTASEIVYDPSQTGVSYKGPQVDLDEDIYDSQSAFETFRNGMGRLLLTTGTKIGSGAAFLASMPYEIGRGMFTDVEGNFISRAADTGLVHLMEGLEDGVKEALPIYKSKYYQDGNVFQKATKIEFWMDDVVDGVAFALSSYVGGGAVAKLGTGAKLATGFRSMTTRALGRAAATSDEALKLRELASLAGKIDKVTATALMTSSEAMFEAAEVQKSILSNPDLVGKMSQEELNLLAAQRARDTYLLNVAAIAPSNLFEMSSLFNKIKLGGRKTLPSQKNADMNIGVERSPGKLAGQLADNTKELTGLRALWSNPKTKLARTILGNMAAEGLYEENIQYSIQKIGEHMNNNLDEPTDNMRSFFDSAKMMFTKAQMASGLFNDQERLQAVVLGGIIGAGQSTLANIPALNRMMGGDGGVLAEEQNNKAKREKLLAALNDASLDLNLNPLDIFQRSPERNIKVRVEKDPADPTNNKFFITDTTETGAEEKQVSKEEFESVLLQTGIDPTDADLEAGNPVDGKIGSSIMIDSSGNPIVNEQKLKAQLAKLQRKEFLDDVHEAMSQSPEANKLGIQMIRNEKLAMMAHEHFRAGMAHLLYDKLEMFSQATTEELAAFGYGANDNIQAEKERAKTFIQGLEKLYNNVENGLLPDTNSKEDRAINEQRKLVAYDRGQRAYTLQFLLRENLNELTTLSKDIEAFVATVKPTDTTNAYLNELRVALDLLTGTMMNSDAADPINNAPGVMTEFNNELGKLLRTINMLVDAISNPKKATGEPMTEEELAAEEARASRLTDTSIISPYHTLKNKLDRIEIVNEELTAEIEDTVAEYRKITDITIDNKLTTAANIALGIFTGGSTLGLINYDRFMGMRTNGFQYFKNNRESIFTKYSKRGGKTIDLTTEPTLENYNKFVQRKVKLMKLTRRLQAANRTMFGNMWKDFLKEGGSFGELIKLILDTEASLTAQDANEIIGLVEERVNRYNRFKEIKDKLLDTISQNSDELNFFSDGMTAEQIEELRKEIQNAMEQLKQVNNEMDLIASEPKFDIINPSDLIALLRSRVRDNIADLTDAELEREIADELMNPAKAALAAFKNNSEYEDITELQRVKTILDNLKNLYKQKKDLLANPKFNRDVENGFMNELNELIKEVEEAIKEVEKRLNDRNRAELAAYKNYIESLFNALFAPTTGIVDEMGDAINKDTDLKSKIAQAFEAFNNDLAAAEADENITPLQLMEAGIAIESMIWSVVLSLDVNPVTRDQFLNIAQSKNNALVDKLKSSPFYTKYKGAITTDTNTEDDSSAVAAMERALPNMSVSSLAKGFLSLMFDLGGKMTRRSTPFDLHPDSAYSKYLVHQDLHTLLADLEAEDRSKAPSEAPATKEELIETIKMFIEMKALRELSQSSGFTQVHSNVYEKLLKNLRAEQTKYNNGEAISLLPFSLRQRTSIFQLMRFFNTRNIDLTGKDPNNLGFWAYMRGAAGTGKTEVIVKWLNSMLDKSISRDDVLVGASNANAAVGVNKSFPSTKGGLEFDKFMEELELAIKENRGYSLILFDEVGALNIHQLTRFVDATKEMRKINPNVKVLVLGDPNQLVTDNTGIPSIELKFGTASIPGLPFIQQIDPLTIRYRSDNSAVVNIQDGFIRKIQRVKDLVGKMNKGPKEILTNEDPLFGSYIEETTGQLLTVLKNNIETSPTRERAIIVSTEAQKKSWQSKLSTALGATHTVKVYTINEAQGMSIPEVYVDMQYDPSIYPQIATYNKAMYTATSRARDFLYVGNVPGGSTVSDPNMLEVMQQLAESKKLGYDMAIANLEKQKRYRDMFFDEGIPPAASGSKPSPPAPGAAPTSAGGGGTTATPGKSSTTTSSTSSTAEAGATSSTSTEESGDYIEDGIIQTNGPLVETVDNITYGTANKQREPDRENEDALFVNVKSGRFAITDGMGGEGSVTMSPAEAARFTIGWLFGKMKKTLNDLLYEEYLRNPAITTEEAIDFLNKNGRSISKTSALSTAVTRIINTFKTKGSISGLKGLRAGATGIKAIKEGPNLYKITKMGDTVYFVVDKDGNIRKKHGMSTEAVTDGVIYSIVDGKPSIYSPPVHTVTIQLKEGETLVLASDFIETEEAAYDFIDTDYGININFAKFQMKNKRDDSTFIVIRHDGTIVAPGGKSTTTSAPTDTTKPEDTTEDSTAEDTTTDEETTKPPGDTIIHEDPDEEEPLGDSMSIEEEVEDVVDEGDTTEIEDELPISKGKTKGLFETIVDGIKATNSNLKKIFTKSNLLDKKDIHSDNATFYPMMFELPNGTLGSFEGLRREFDKAQSATGGRSLEMMAIKIRTDLTDASKFHYAIVYRIPSTDTKNMYFAKVAVLSQKGYERLPDGYKDMPARVVKDVGRTRKTLDSIISIAGNTLSPEEEASKFIMTDTEDHPSTALAVKFKPSDSPPSRLTGTKLNGILKKIASAGFTVDKSKVEIRVFDERGLTAMYKKYPKIATNLSPGMSYLIVPTKESPETPIVIRLTPSKLNNDNYGPELKLINSYIDKVEKFQKMTKTMTKKGILSKPLILGSDSDFAKLISAMSNIYQHLVPNESGKLRPLGKSITLNQVTTEHPFYGELLKLMFDGGGVIPNTNKDGDDVFDTTLFETTYKPLFELAYEIDTAIHGERVSKRNHRGEVQAAFDKIARSNLVWFPTDSSNDMVILRDQRVGYKQTPGGKWSQVTQIGGRSLLGYASPEKTAGLFDGKVETRIKAKIKKRFATILKRELTNAEIEQIDGFELSKSLPTKDGSRRTQLTTDELRALMDMSTGESTVNRDFGLRVPIQKSMVNNKKMPGIRTTVPGEEMNIALEEHFETNFDTVTPTKMSIFIANQPASKEGIFPPPPPPSGTPTPEETITPEETTTEPTLEPTPTITEKSLFDILDPTTTIEDTSLNVDTMGTTSNPDPNPETIVPEEPVAETVPDPTPTLTVDEEIEKIERQRDYKLQHGIKNKNRLFGKLRDPSIKSPIEKLNIVYELLYFMETVGVYFTQDEAEEMDRVIAEMKREGYRIVEEDIVNKRFTEEGAIEGRKGSIVVLKDRPDNTLEENVTLIDVVIKPTIMKGDEMVQVPHVGIVRGSSKLGLKDIGKGTKKTTVLTEKEWIEKRKTEGTIVQKLNAKFDQQIKEVKERAAEKQNTEQPVSQPATQVTPTKVHPLDIEPKELSDPNRKKPKLKVGISGHKDGYKFLYGSGGKTTDFDGRTMLNRTYAEGSSAYGVSVNRGVVTYSKHVGIRDRGRGAPGILTVMIELPAGARMMPKDIIELLDEMMEDTVNRFTAGTFETTEDFSKDYSKIDEIASKFEDRTYFDNSLDKKIFNNNRTSNKPEESPAYAYHDSVDQLKEYLHDLTNPNYAKYARVYFTDSSTKGTKNDILETLNKVEGADLTKPQPSSQPVVSNKVAQPISIHPLDKIPDELKNPNREKPKIEIAIAGAQGGFKGFYNNEAIFKELFDTRGMGGTMPNTGATGYGVSISEGAIVYSKSTAIQDTDRDGGSYGTVDVYLKMPAGGRMMPKDIIAMLDELMEEALITHTDGRFRTGRGFGTNDHSFVERIHEKYKDKTYFDQSIDITQFDKWSAGKEWPAYAFYNSEDHLKEYLHDIQYKNTKDYRRVYFVDIATKNTNKDLSKAVGTTKNADLSRPQQFKDSTESKSSDKKNEPTPSPGVIPSGSLTSENIADLQGSVDKAISMFFDYLSKNDPNWDPDLARLLLTDSSFKKDIMQLVVDLNIDYGNVDKIATNAVSIVFYRIFKCS